MPTGQTEVFRTSDTGDATTARTLTQSHPAALATLPEASPTGSRAICSVLSGCGSRASRSPLSQGIGSGLCLAPNAAIGAAGLAIASVLQVAPRPATASATIQRCGVKRDRIGRRASARSPKASLARLTAGCQKEPGAARPPDCCVTPQAARRASLPARMWEAAVWSRVSSVALCVGEQPRQADFASWFVYCCWCSGVGGA
jgi:hypothetical protein